MRFFVVNLGCKVNRVESDSFISALLGRGFVLSREQPDVVIVNTCTVTGEAEKKTRKAVRQALHAHPGATVVVTGCAAAINPEEFLALSSRVVVCGKADVVALVQELSGEEEPPQVRVVPRYGAAFPTRVGIKAQDGCDNACTFCIVHVARGRGVSVPAAHIISQAREQVSAGARELVLTGINLATYHDGPTNLAALLRMLRAEVPHARLRIGSVEPRDVTSELISVLAEEDGMVARHLHMPLQSGSTRVLREMARPYTADDFLRLVDTLYQALPSLSLSTDIICGFPGETDDDFAQTLDVARACRFSKIHVFRYSKRAGTPAAARADQIAPHISAERASALSDLAATLRLDQARKRLGTQERILCEGEGLGTTESYFTVRCEQMQRGALELHTLVSVDEEGIISV